MTPDIRPFDAALGAEVRGVDLSRDLDAAAFAAIERAWNEHSVLLFRDQAIDETRHVAFSRRFGDLEIHVLDQYLHPGHPEILIVSNVMDGDRHVGIYDAGRYWHTDLSYMAVPSRGSLLYAIEVPRDDAGSPLGDTLFASTAAAYDALPPDTKHRISGLTAEFSLANRHAKLVADGDPDAALSDTHQEKAPAGSPQGSARPSGHRTKEHLRQRRDRPPASSASPKTRPGISWKSCALTARVPSSYTATDGEPATS